jgi:addiction module HigA family antidote
VSIRIEDAARLDFSDVAGGKRIGPVTPGEVLREEFMAPLGLSGRALARELGVPANRITEIVAGTRAVTAETAILLGERFGTSAEFWLNLQMAHDLEEARQRRRVRKGVGDIGRARHQTGKAGRPA